MKIIKDFPPNISEIKSVFPNLPKGQIFAYGETIFNPSGEEIPLDIQFHEQTHQEQMGKNPEMWWRRYLIDREFRKKMEVQAFALQLKFVKKFYKNEGVKKALDEMSENLSKNYKLGITKYQAETMIRHYNG